MTTAHLRVERHDTVLHLHLDKPKKRNALDDDMVATIIDEVDGAGRDEAVRSILITAEGDHFCSGFDIVRSAPPDSRAVRDPGADRRRGARLDRRHRSAPRRRV